MSLDHTVIIFVHAFIIALQCFVHVFACNDHSLFMLLSSFAFLSIKKLNKEYIFLPMCFTFLNSVRSTSPHPNTQKPLGAPLANTEVYKFHCHW